MPQPSQDSHPRSGTPADIPFLSRSCCRCPDSLRRGKFHRPWRRSCRRSGRASHCRARDPGSAGTSLWTSTPRVTGKWECRPGGSPHRGSLGTYLPYCQCKWAGVLQLSPPPGAGLLSVPSAPVRKHRAAISPCLWDLLPTPSSSGWAVSEAPQAPALLCAPSMSPVPDLGAAGCDPSTPHHLPSPVLFQGGSTIPACG